MFLGEIRPLLMLAQDEGNCAAQVRQHSTSVQIAKYASADSDEIKERLSVDINCPTDQVTIDGTGDEVKQELAEEMVTCYNRWGRGRLELFSKDNAVYCHVCDIVEFEKDQEITDFANYLANHPLGGEKTYHERLLPFATKNFEEVAGDIESADYPTINTEERYGIIYRHVKGKDAILGVIGEDTQRNSILFGGVTAGAVGGALVCSWTGLGAFMCAKIGGSIGAGGGLWGAGQLISAIDFKGQQRLAQTGLVPYDNESISELGCQVIK